MYKHRRSSARVNGRGRTPLLVLFTGFIQHIAIELQNALGYFQTDRNQDNQRKR